MKDLLVGSTGFVGGNLLLSHNFEASCHSTDISDYFGSAPELCVYAGVPSAMFLANSNPEADYEVMVNARENLRRINPGKTVLISSIAVLGPAPRGDEDAPIDEASLAAYGENRLKLEQWVREDFDDCVIVRLPALFGAGLKKNFLFDLKTIVPKMLKPDKYNELAEKNEAVKKGYTPADNGFYVMNNDVPFEVLKEFFAANDFNALAFTDSRSRFQFYNLGRLQNDILVAVNNRLPVVNLATPPLEAKEVYEYITGKPGWTNELLKPPFDYDMRTKYSGLFGGGNGYILNRDEELAEILTFMKDGK